ncbi:MAG: hypothetical protein NTW18_01260 [Candidatus Omnitrophica bacterium]|nr:hypothetical protein [Candidatus Omnitrophota bacterium]
MSCVPRRNINIEAQRLSLQSIVEEALGDIEFAYESKNLEGFTGLLDQGFPGKARFQAVLADYFLYLDKPHLHFVIDMVIADKNGIKVNVHWFKKAITNLNVAIKSRGSSQFLFKRYPEGLRLKRVFKENPFY